jgi:hypothetical protein
VVTSTIAVLGEREERSTVEAQLSVNQALAEALSGNVAQYVRLHQQALSAVASLPGLSAMTPEQQAALLRRTTGAYPDVIAFSTYGLDGRPISRGDGREPPTAPNDWINTAVSGVPVPVQAGVSPLISRPVFRAARVIRDQSGLPAGAATVALESSHLVDLLDRSSTPGLQAFVVDQDGVVIAHSDASELPWTFKRRTTPHAVQWRRLDHRRRPGPA